MQLLKEKPYLWPVFAVLGILGAAITIAIFAERERAQTPKAPKEQVKTVEPLPQLKGPGAPKAAVVGTTVICVGGALNLSAPPLKPMKLFTRSSDGTWLQLSCDENSPPTATGLIDQRVEELEKKVKELKAEIELLNRKGKGK